MTGGSMVGRVTARLTRSAALGVTPLTAPVLLFVPLGFVLGPSGAGLVSRVALEHLDLATTVALATLGVIIGLAAAREFKGSRALFAAALVEAGITIAVVAGAAAVLLRAWNVPVGLPVTLVAVALGLCASASAAPAVTAGAGGPREIAARVADLDDVLPILLSAIVLDVAAPVGNPWAILFTAALGVAVATCGWLLLERARDLAERGVFVLGTLVLLAGAPAYLNLSPLLAGMAAGWFWVVAPGGCDRLVTAELRKVQHPLLVLVLVTAGASLDPSAAGVWLFAAFVLFRLAGKLIGGWTASRIARGVAPSDLGAYLIPPGVIGVAFALNLQQVSGGAASAIVFAVTAGALVAEMIAIVVTPAPQPD